MSLRQKTYDEIPPICYHCDHFHKEVCRGDKWYQVGLRVKCKYFSTLVIIDGKYVLRVGKDTDRRAKRFPAPTYVLEYDGEQVGSANGPIYRIQRVEIFEEYRNRGHGTKFVELMEQYAKRLGHKDIMILGVGGDTREDREKMERILNKRKFKQLNEDWIKEL